MTLPTDTAIAIHVRAALGILNDLTTDEFAKGGDRPARAHLVSILCLLGRETVAERDEYAAEVTI